MAQFTVYQNKSPKTKTAIPYLLDVQADLLQHLNTTVVVPLYPLAQNSHLALKHLTPTFKIDGNDYLMLTPQMAGINRRELGHPVVDLASERSEIIASIDFLITGF